MHGWLEEMELDFLNGSPDAVGWHYTLGCETRQYSFQDCPASPGTIWGTRLSRL